MSIELRKYPYPYRAMLAICSDLDETPDFETYIEISRFLNTKESTAIGIGVDLEIGNTIYFDMPKNQFSYSNSDEHEKKLIHQLIRSGHIDCLHSFGDLTTTRDRVKACWSELEKNDSTIEVWVDHAQAPTNFDNDIMEGMGALPNSSCYHADISCVPGRIRFVWKGRVTSVIAQNSDRVLTGIFNSQEKLKSLKTITLEIVKGVLGKLGNKKYQMHAMNRILRKTQLVDGANVIEFMRSNPSWAGVSTFETANGISQVLSEKMLDQLLKVNGCTVLYTHLGKIDSCSTIFDQPTQAAFRLLATYKKTILVTTTRRLLGYSQAIDDLKYRATKKENRQQIWLQSQYGIQDLEGLTWYVDEPLPIDLYINNQFFSTLEINPPDESNRHSVSIPWTNLKFPHLDAIHKSNKDEKHES